MLWFERLQKAIDYIEAHLLEEIHMEDIAEQVNFSPYEFCRAFSFISGMTLNTYIRNRRLSLAGQELIGTDKKVIDIAMKYGFETQVGFTKAFTRFHGVAPKYAKRSGTQLVLFNPLTIKVSLEGASKIDYRMERKENQRFLAVVKEFPVEIINDDSNHDISDFWGECWDKNRIEPLRALIGGVKGKLYGLCAPLKENETSFEYGIGVLLDHDAKVDDASLPSGVYRVWETDACTYVVFRCIGKDGDCISEAWEKFYKEFLPQSDYESSMETDYEVYFEEGDLFCELWIPIQKR